MAKAQGQFSEGTEYLITVSGLANVEQDGTQKRVPYSLRSKINGVHVKAGALHTFVKYIAPVEMPKHFPGYNSLATHELTGVECPANPDYITSNPSLLANDKLHQFIEDNDLPIQVELYDDYGQLRQAILECLEDEQSFEKNQDMLRAKRGPTVQLRRMALELNAEGSTVVAPPAETKKQAAKENKEIEATAAPPTGETTEPKKSKRKAASTANESDDTLDDM